MPGGFSVFVNIGANLLPSLGAAASAVEKRFGLMNRRLKITAAESKVAFKEMTAAFSPLAAMAAAGGLSFAFKGILGEGAEYQHQLSMLRIAGRTSKEVAAAIGAANRTMADIPTSTLNDNLKVLNETTLAYGSFGHAVQNLSYNQKMGGMLQLSLGDKFGDSGDFFNKFIRGMEIRGSTMNQARYQRESSALYQAMVSSGGKINADEILGFVQQANPAVRGYDQRFFTRIAPSLIQEFGGERAGTALTAFNNQILGRVSLGGKALVARWVKLGLVPEAGTGGNDSKTGWTPGSMKGTSLAMSDPLAWTEQYLLPALQKSGVNVNDEKAMTMAAKTLFGRETGARLASTLLSPAQRMRLHKDEAMYSKAMGPDAALSSAMKNDPMMEWKALTASFQNLETAIGKGLISAGAISAMNNLAKAINWLARQGNNHPNVAAAAGGGLGVVTFAAVLRLFGIRIFALTRSLAGLFGRGVMALLPAIGNAFVGFFRTGLWRLIYGGGRWIVVGIARLAPFLLEGLAGLVPTILEGIGAAIAAVLGAPIWLVVAAVAAVAAAGAFVWHFRVEIWNGLRRGWENLKAAFTTLGWAGVGKTISSIILNSLTFGFYSWIPNMIGALKQRIASGTPAGPQGKPADPTMRGGLAGMRAAGGPVWPGGTFLVGENGPELFTPGRSGTIIPHSELLRRRAARGGSGGAPVTFHIYGATDPKAVARAVDDRLRYHANGTSALLSD